MLASCPASMVNQKPADLGIPNRFRLNSSRFSPARRFAHRARRALALATIQEAAISQECEQSHSGPWHVESVKAECLARSCYCPTANGTWLPGLSGANPITGSVYREAVECKINYCDPDTARKWPVAALHESGPSRTSRDARFFAAVGGKADVSVQANSTTAAT
jgi:hypothetical protein